MSSIVLQAESLTKTYKSGANSLTVLDQVSFSVNQGDTLSIIGPSGSGKTTLLGLCAGLDQPSTGIITLHGIQLNVLNEDQRAGVRNQYRKQCATAVVILWAAEQQRPRASRGWPKRNWFTGAFDRRRH